MCVIVTSQADTMPSLTQLARMSDANPTGRASHGTTANASTATATRTT